MDIRQEEDLTERDFKTHPVWRIARHVEDGTAPTAEIDERSFSPWTKAITKDIVWPHSKLLVSGSFHFADGSVYPGFFQLVGTNWDDPLPPRKMRDGSFAKPLQWSARRGGAELSILSLISPIVFVKGDQLDFDLHRMLQVRETHVRVFYMQVTKTPGKTFPVRFETHHGIDGTVNSGIIPGFYRFPLDQPHEISTGEDIWLKFKKK
ncbi:MAG TPA: hypothetical protein VK819_10765 [Acidobacteriaceae bacterium]|nr:hypothetical protein [Acidobacteriaceae bacterium]